MEEKESLVRALVSELQQECYYEVVKENVLQENGLTKEMVSLPRMATSGSAGADFFTPVPIDLPAGEEVKVCTGIKAHCAPFTRLSVYPKSGLGFKYYTRLANTVGIIDADYYGNESNDGCIFVKIRNEGKKPLHLDAGDAFCQGVFELYIPDRDFSSSKARERKGGFGSTLAHA